MCDPFYPLLQMSRAKFYRLASFVFLVFAASCSEPESTSVDTGYFDAEAYFESEAARLAGKGPLLKVSGWKGNWDSTVVEITDWKKELEPFSRCSIHRPSMRNSYQVDSLPGQDGLRILYTALERLPVQRVEVWKKGETVTRFTAIAGDTNLIFGLQRQLEYVADSGYLISGRQEMKMMEPADYSIRLLWK